MRAWWIACAIDSDLMLQHAPSICHAQQTLRHACDDADEKRMAIQYYTYEHAYSFLYSKVAKVTNWVGCHDPDGEPGPEPFMAQCYAKLQYCILVFTCLLGTSFFSRGPARAR